MSRIAHREYLKPSLEMFIACFKCPRYEGHRLQGKTYQIGCVLCIKLSKSKCLNNSLRCFVVVVVVVAVVVVVVVVVGQTVLSIFSKTLAYDCPIKNLRRILGVS